MPTLSCDPAYSQLLDTNQELHDELQDEISINKSNEKKIRSLVKEVEQCYRTISLQDNTIIAHEKEIEELKCQITDLQKQLRILQQDKKFKEKAYRFDVTPDVPTTFSHLLNGIDVPPFYKRPLMI